jgi:hypothetical protein
VPNYPFADKGDLTHIVVAQPYEIPADEYVPDALNTTRTFTINGTDKTLYNIGDTRSASSDQKFQRFTRRWANIPASRDEYESHVAQFPGLVMTNRITQPFFALLPGGGAVYERTWYSALLRRKGFVEGVISKVTFDYFNVTGTFNESAKTVVSADAITLNTVQRYAYSDKLGFSDYTYRSPMDISLCDVDAYETSTGSSISNALTVPTRTEYLALGAYGVVLECRLRRYAGNIYVRITRKVTPL